jgi:hypothetical protein
MPSLSKNRACRSLFAVKSANSIRIERRVRSWVLYTSEMFSAVNPRIVVVVFAARLKNHSDEIAD